MSLVCVRHFFGFFPWLGHLALALNMVPIPTLLTLAVSCSAYWCLPKAQLQVEAVISIWPSTTQVTNTMLERSRQAQQNSNFVDDDDKIYRQNHVSNEQH